MSCGPGVINPGNTNLTRTEPLITVQKLKDTYLFGVVARNEEGEILGDEAIQMFINTAVTTLEADLDISIIPKQEIEYKDYFFNDYQDWGFLQLNKYPVLSIECIRSVYTKEFDENGEPKYDTVLNIPKEWIRLNKESGLVRLIPNNKFPGRLAIDGSGAWFPELFNRHTHIPDLWEVKYTHGFCDGAVPALLNSAIGLIASNYYLNIAGDLLIGAGIAGTSISLDGLSQSIQTTSSAENNGFSAKIKDNNRQLYGDKTLGSTGVIEALRRYYKGQPMSII